jgi:hypothetical protein
MFREVPVSKGNLFDFENYRNSCPFVFNFENPVDGGVLVSALQNTGSGDAADDSKVMVDVLVAKDGRTFLKHELTDTETVTIEEGLKQILSNCETVSPRRYLRAYLDKIKSWRNVIYPMLDILSPLRKSGENFKEAGVGIWVSQAGCETPLHFDLCHGFLLQQQGCKTFYLAPPRDTNCLYWNPSKLSKNKTTSEIDFFAWKAGDMEQQRRFPEVDGAAWKVARLSPGMGLYTPPGWWHAVISETTSISVLVPLDPSGEQELLNLPHNVALLS